MKARDPLYSFIENTLLKNEDELLRHYKESIYTYAYGIEKTTKEETKDKVRVLIDRYVKRAYRDEDEIDTTGLLNDINEL